MSRPDIHADDYGYSMNTSLDILECIKAGNLDSFSIICNTKWFEESMDLLYKEIPSLPFLPNMSIHLNIPEGKSESKLFPMSWGKLFLSSYSFNRNKVKNELKKDLKKQLETTQKVIDKCIEIANINNIRCEQKGMRIDSHIHTHLIPVVWDALTEVIEEEKYNIEYIRNPKEPIIPFIRETSLWKTYAPINLVKNRILMFYSGKVDRYCDRHGIAKMYMWGLVMSSHMDYDRIQKVYPLMKEYADKKGRKLELLFHPGKATKDEYSEEMDKDYFRDANTSENRHIEKNAVMNIKNIVD